MHIVIVLPTYNEKGNIIQMLESLSFQRHYLKDDILSILVVDDMSPDNTGKIVKEFAQTHQNIFLLQGRKNGLGNAYIRGFKYAITNLRADVVFEMDADFSHDPNDIPRFVEEIKKGNDFVIGSRYIPQGTIPAEWPLLRKLNSKWGNIFAKYIGGIKGVNDCTSGFRAIRTSLLHTMRLNKLKVKGYAFQINLLHRAVQCNARIKEIPINFKDRVNGESKISYKDILEFIYNAILLRFPFVRLLSSPYLLTTLIVLIIFAALTKFLPSLTLESIGIVSIISISLILTIQGIINLYTLLYAWEDLEKSELDKTPDRFMRPELSFTALIPARNEELVIKDTINAINNIDYPENLKEIILICREDDLKTIHSAKEILNSIGKNNLKLVTFPVGISSKPHALNIGLQYTTKEVVVIFDAEDQPHKDIYRVINTVMLKKSADVVQSGVQLMNYKSNWFSTLNVLEYFFWFKSSLHFFAKKGIIPLGGNTVFFKKKILDTVGGWDEDCLTEDADIGYSLSTLGAKIEVVYSEEHVTKEETPTTLSEFIKQRTRWNQGFLQIFKKGNWHNLNTLGKKLIAAYILLMPELQSASLLFVPISLLLMLHFRLPVIFALLSILPLITLVLQLITYCVGLYEFLKVYKIKHTPLFALRVILTYIPYQILLSLSAMRALYRVIMLKQNWEKTLHINAHRNNIDINAAL